MTFEEIQPSVSNIADVSYRGMKVFGSRDEEEKEKENFYLFGQNTAIHISFCKLMSNLVRCL